MLHHHGNTGNLVEVLDLWQPPSLLARLSRTSLPFITTGISMTSSMHNTSTIFWISWTMGTVSAQLGWSPDLHDVWHQSL